MLTTVAHHCPECSGEVKTIDDEIVCTRCGLVVNKAFHRDMRVPMGETRSPTCSLDAENGSLGTTQTTKELCKVIAVDHPTETTPTITCPHCHKEIPLPSPNPVRQIRVLTKRNKHDIIARMDRYGSQLIDKHLNSRLGRDSQTSIIFAQKLGKALDRVGLTLVLRDDGQKAKKMAEATFLWTWKKMGLEGAATIATQMWKKGGAPEILEVNRIMSSLPAE